MVSAPKPPITVAWPVPSVIWSLPPSVGLADAMVTMVSTPNGLRLGPSAGARTMKGELLGDSARGKTVVVHLGAADEMCLSQVTSAGVSELVVGLSADAADR